MKNATLAHLCLPLFATAIGLCLAVQCKAQYLSGFTPEQYARLVQMPVHVPNCCLQTFALTRQLATARDSTHTWRDSVATLNTRVDTLIAADKRVRIALKAEADAAVAKANAELTKQDVSAQKVEGMLREATARADKAEAEAPRTWFGRQIRYAWNGLACVGVATVAYTVLKVFVLR